MGWESTQPLQRHGMPVDPRHGGLSPGWRWTRDIQGRDTGGRQELALRGNSPRQLETRKMGLHHRMQLLLERRPWLGGARGSLPWDLWGRENAQIEYPCCGCS